MHEEESSGEDNEEIEGKEDIVGFDKKIFLIHDITNIRDINMKDGGDEIKCESTENDDILEKIFRSMKDAKQELFTGWY